MSRSAIAHLHQARQGQQRNVLNQRWITKRDFILTTRIRWEYRHRRRRHRRCLRHLWTMPSQQSRARGHGRAGKNQRCRAASHPIPIAHSQSTPNHIRINSTRPHYSIQYNPSPTQHNQIPPHPTRRSLVERGGRSGRSAVDPCRRLHYCATLHLRLTLKGGGARASGR